MALADQKLAIGWREWVGLPQIGLPLIKAKVDTGARTSALHAYFIEPYQKDQTDWIYFGIHPIQNNPKISVECHAPVFDQRVVRDSGGHEELRYVIQSLLQLGGLSWPIEITLTNRDNMKFRMLLGRSAMANRVLIDPAKSYLSGRNTRAKVQKHKIKKPS